MTDFEIRPARPDEARRLSSFMRELFVAAYRHCSTPENVAAFLDATYSEAQQRGELENPAIETVVVERGAEWLGFAQLRLAIDAPDGVSLAHGAELGRIYLAPAAQGRGVGVALLREIERRARRHGRDGLWLNAWQEAPQAVAFYEREGFMRCGTTHFVVGDDAKLDWRMVKRFGTPSDARPDAPRDAVSAVLPVALRERLDSIVEVAVDDARISAVLVAGSAATGTTDAWSDLDLVVVCREEAWPAILDERVAFAARAGALLEAFTGEHVGEPRLLICLYGPPLVHVDLKFVTADALAERVDEPRVLFDRDGEAARALAAGTAHYPPPDLPWIEARFWIWVHYAATKLGRGECLEAAQMLAWLRWRALGPLALLEAGATPNGLRRLETATPARAAQIAATFCAPDARAIGQALQHTAALYVELRARVLGTHEVRAVQVETLRYLDAVIAGLS